MGGAVSHTSVVSPLPVIPHTERETSAHIRSSGLCVCVLCSSWRECVDWTDSVCLTLHSSTVNRGCHGND